MLDALFGTETEFACAGEFEPARAATIVKNQVFGSPDFGIIDPAPREWGETPGNGGFLFNGGRLYIDSGHLEYATPECRTLRGLVAQETAGERIVLEALDGLESRSKIFFIKNNADYFGNTYGYHENYCLGDSPQRPEVVTALMPFLVTRQIFAGAGLLVRNAGGTEFDYEIAQRSGFVEIDQSSRVRFGGRPIVNLRDEPLGDRRRLHVICGDANRSEFVTALKIGTTALVAQLADDGWSPEIELANPVQAMRSIAKDIEGPWPVPTVLQGDVPAVGIQRMYLVEAERRFAGRDAGWVAAIGGLAGGADFIIVPEMAVHISSLVGHLERRRSSGRDFSIIVVAEGATIDGLTNVMPEEDARDEFGHKRLEKKQIGQRLADAIESESGMETRVTVLGHVQRGGPPSVFDRVLATRLGVTAVDMVNEKQWGFMSALQGSAIVRVSLDEAVASTRELDLELYKVAENFF